MVINPDINMCIVQTFLDHLGLHIHIIVYLIEYKQIDYVDYSIVHRFASCEFENHIVQLVENLLFTRNNRATSVIFIALLFTCSIPPRHTTVPKVDFLGFVRIDLIVERFSGAK